MEYLSVKEVAELKGCSERYIQKNIADGKLEAKCEINSKGKNKFLVPITALPESLQNKYYGKLMNDAQLCLPKAEPKADKPAIIQHRTTVRKEFGQFSADEREQITFWTDLLREWRIRREEYDNCAETSYEKSIEKRKN